MFSTDTIADCMKASFANAPFPKVVERLAGAGVKSYTADLVKLRKTYYGAEAEGHDETMPLEKAQAIAPALDSAAVAATVKTIQRGEIGYAEFLHRIMASGCSHYEVFFAGRKAMYFGRAGEFYTEPFPAQK
jgi:uncharacterized protein YbcV (DUF1398 family)